MIMCSTAKSTKAIVSFEEDPCISICGNDDDDDDALQCTGIKCTGFRSSSDPFSTPRTLTCRRLHFTLLLRQLAMMMMMMVMMMIMMMMMMDDGCNDNVARFKSNQLQWYYI